MTGKPATEIREALRPVPKRRKYPALVDLPEIRKLIARMDVSASYPVTRLASRFLAIVAQRLGMMHRMKWENLRDIDWDAGPESSSQAHWYIPSDEMKLEFDRRGDEEFDHDVPLRPQAVEVLMEVRRLTGLGTICLPQFVERSCTDVGERPSSLYRREGYKGRHVPHGWRTSFSTVINERSERALGADQRFMVDRLVIDIMLAICRQG